MIAFGAALTRSSSPWLWLPEIGVTIALASASWRFVETPIMRNGLGATGRHWRQVLTEAIRPVGTAGRAPVSVALE